MTETQLVARAVAHALQMSLALFCLRHGGCRPQEVEREYLLDPFTHTPRRWRYRFPGEEWGEWQSCSVEFAVF